MPPATPTPLILSRPSLIERLRLAAADIKLAHSVFALPFAILAAFMARPHNPAAPDGGGSWPSFAAQLALVVVCMVAARTWAMLVNRLADRTFDAANPRTARRVIASGRLTPRDGLLFALAAALVFIAACSLFLLLFKNPWPLPLSIPALAWIALYSYTKRFTAACHIVLGGALAASPLAAAIAINPSSLAATPALWFLAGMVLLWVAGFDVIYALQDIAFDRAAGLLSLPGKLGHVRAVRLSRFMHAGAFAMLAAAWWSGSRAGASGDAPPFGPIFASAVTLVGILLVIEHAILARRGQAGLELAFFTINGVVSCLLGAAGVIDVLT